MQVQQEVSQSEEYHPKDQQLCHNAQLESNAWTTWSSLKGLHYRRHSKRSRVPRQALPRPQKAWGNENLVLRGDVIASDCRRLRVMPDRRMGRDLRGGNW